MVSALVVYFYAFTSPLVLTCPLFDILFCHYQLLANFMRHTQVQPVATDAITFIGGVYMWTQLFLTLWSALSADH